MKTSYTASDIIRLDQRAQRRYWQRELQRLGVELVRFLVSPFRKGHSLSPRNFILTCGIFVCLLTVQGVMDLIETIQIS